MVRDQNVDVTLVAKVGVVGHVKVVKQVGLPGDERYVDAIELVANRVGICRLGDHHHHPPNRVRQGHRPVVNDQIGPPHCDKVVHKRLVEVLELAVVEVHHKEHV